jgi:hypothetical protein
VVKLAETEMTSPHDAPPAFRSEPASIAPARQPGTLP